MRKLDARVQDVLVLEEIELYGELVIAASASDCPLSLAEIDRILGVASIHHDESVIRLEDVASAGVAGRA